MEEVTFNYENHWEYFNEVKWLKHYSSNHEILLVGEGDFSFSLSLAIAFGSAINIVATSLDSYDEVIKKYKRAKTNLEFLRSFGAQLLHGVDAIKMKLHTDLQMRKFDRIVYNFPHAGFLGKEDDHRVIMKHRSLVHGFLRNASAMLRPSGEVHVSHKTTCPFNLWNIEELAFHSSLALLERVDFKIEDYPNYKNKRGDGNRADEPFPLGECCTYKFILSSIAKNFLHHTGNESTVLNHAPVINTPGSFRIFRESFEHTRSTFGHADDHFFYNAPHMVRIRGEKCETKIDANSMNDYINHLNDLQCFNRGTLASLQNRWKSIACMACRLGFNP